MKETNKYHIIAETAFSHEGDYNYLLKQIENASKAQADIVKFQVLIDPDNFYSSNSQITEAKNLIFTELQWLEAFHFAKKKNLKVLALPLTIKSLTFLIGNQKLIDFFEIHSINFQEVPIIEMLANTKKTNIFLGIGGRYLQEIKFLKNKLRKHHLVAMFGFQSFPTNEKKLNLGKLNTLRRQLNLSLGYADHTIYNSSNFITLSKYAYLLGARYFELHIVNKKGEKRIDYNSGHNKNDFLKLRNEINLLIEIIGNVNFDKLNDAEQLYRQREKSIIAKTDLIPGTKINFNHIEFRIKPKNQKNILSYISEILGKKITNSKSKHDFFYIKDFDE